MQSKSISFGKHNFWTISGKNSQCGPQISLCRAWPRIRRWPSFGLTWWWGCLPFLRLRTTTPTSIAATIAIPANPKVTYTELLSLFNSTWRTEKPWKKHKNCKYMDRLAFFHCHSLTFSIILSKKTLYCSGFSDLTHWEALERTQKICQEGSTAWHYSNQTNR